MKLNHPIRHIFLLLLCAGAFWLYCKNTSTNPFREKDAAFDRTLSPLIFTRHAKCRMDCRHINEMEIREILQHGEINYSKSDLNSKPDPKFALEGKTQDNQQVRVIFAPTQHGLVVITCIDLTQEWACACR